MPVLRDLSSRVKNLLAHLDRELGALAIPLYSYLQPPSSKTLIKYPDLNMLTEYFPGFSKADIKRNKYWESIGTDYWIEKEGQFIIDPKTGWCYFHNFVPVLDSFPYARYPSRSFLKPTLIWIQFKLLISPKRYLFKEAINLIWYGWENYYHFITDIVPILIKIVRLNNRDANSIPVIVPTWIKKIDYIREFLTFFSYFKRINFCYARENEFLCIQQKLILVKTFRVSDEVHFLRRSPMIDYLNKLVPKGSPRRVYVSRPKSGSRLLQNEAAIIEFLVGLDFVILDPSRMKWSEQVESFREVEYCVGIHGAGLTNLVFSKKPHTLIELFPLFQERPLHYEHQAKLLNSNYYFLEGSKLNEFGEFEINVQQLNKLMKIIIK